MSLLTFDSLSTLGQVPRLILGNAYRTTFTLDGDCYDEVRDFLSKEGMAADFTELSTVYPTEGEKKLISELIKKFTEFESKNTTLNKWSVSHVAEIAYEMINSLREQGEVSVLADNMATITANVLTREIVAEEEIKVITRKGYYYRDNSRTIFPTSDDESLYLRSDDETNPLVSNLVDDPSDDEEPYDYNFSI